MTGTCPHCRAGVACRHCRHDSSVAFANALPSGRRAALGTAVADAPTVLATAAVAPVHSTPQPGASLPGVAPSTLPPNERLPNGVPGYRFEQPLGRGGMGTVYLARQLSLDRPVAIKIMAHRWAADPLFVARFTREAFAAALLNHPNVVQIYDIGEHAGLRYFSMEYVPGQTLADHLKAKGRLDAESAVGYVLQAARGLAHAHDRGVIHRDVKPDNLLLDDQGRVKVADLGLVKTPVVRERRAGHPAPRDCAADITEARVALGTPAYMAPEQCRDAASVDHRADIYSLGCTLYVLVTGRPPFEATTAVELMSKHAYEPIVPPELLVGRVPKELSEVILKMLAKDPRERFQSMAEVIDTLEQWLGVRHAGTVPARDEQIDQLESFVSDFNTAPTAVLKSRVVSWSLGGCFLAAVLMLFFGRLGLAFGLAGFVVQSAAAYFVLSGARERTHLFGRVRAAMFVLTPWDGALAAAGTALFALLIWGLGLMSVWAGFGSLAIAAAGVVYLVFDRQVEAERTAGLNACRKLLRRMRLNGLSEDDLRLFVAKYSGRAWEEFFEALFGYEAKVEARLALARGQGNGPRDKFAAWREPLLSLLDRWEKARHAAAGRKFLAKVESAGLSAGGQVAGSLPAIELTAVPRHPLGTGEALATAATGLLVRALLAGVFLGLFAAWAWQNFAPFLAPTPSQAGLWAQLTTTGRVTTAPLVVSGLPPGRTNWVDDATVGWAGVLLLASLFARGPRTGALVILGAVVCAMGPAFGIHTVEPVRPGQVAFLLGSVLALVGYRLADRD